MCTSVWQVYRGLLRSVQVVAIKVFSDAPQYSEDSDEERLQTLSRLEKQRKVLIRQEIAVLKHCRDRNIVQFVGACIRVCLPLLQWQSFMLRFCRAAPACVCLGLRELPVDTKPAAESFFSNDICFSSR